MSQHNATFRVPLLGLVLVVAYPSIAQETQRRPPSVEAIAISSDGNYLAAGDSDGLIKLWNMATCGESATLEGHTRAVRSLTFSPDSKTLASASEDLVQLWEVPSGREQLLLTTEPSKTSASNEGLASLAFSSDGRTLAAARRDGGIVLWNLPAGTTRKASFVDSGASAIAFSTDGKQLAIGSGYMDESKRLGKIELWDVVAGTATAVFKGHPEPVTTIAFSRDGEWLASGAEDAAIRIWHVKDKRLSRTLEKHTSSVQSLAFCPARDGEWQLASASFDGSILVWDRLGSNPISEVLHHSKHHAQTVAFSPDGARLAAGFSDGRVRVWNLKNNRELLDSPMQPFDAPLLSIAWSADGKTISTGDADGTVTLWNPGCQDVVTRLMGAVRPVRRVQFSRDDRLLAAGSGDAVTIWDLRRRERTWTLRGHKGTVESPAFSPDGRFLAAATSYREDTDAWGNFVTIWDLRTGENVRHLDGLEHRVFTVAFSPDGKTLATGGGERGRNDVSELKLWNWGSGELIAPIVGKHYRDWTFHDACFSSDAKWLATCNAWDATVKIWDVGKRCERFVLHGRRVSESLSEEERRIVKGDLQCSHISRAYRARFSPDGRLVAVGGDSGLNIWDARSGELVVDSRGPEVGFLPTAVADRRGAQHYWCAIDDVAFSPDAMTVAAAASWTTRPVLWNLAGPKPRVTVRASWPFALGAGGSRLAAVTSPSKGGKQLTVWTLQRDGSGVAVLAVLDIDRPGLGAERARAPIRFSEDGESVALQCQKECQVWDLRVKGQPPKSYESLTAAMLAKAFVPDERALVEDGATANCLRRDTFSDTLSAARGTRHVSVVQHPSAFTVARVDVQDYEADQKKDVQSFFTRIMFPSSLAVSANGRMFAVGDGVGCIKLWDAGTNSPRSILLGHTCAVYSLRFSPDGRLLASGSRDNSVYIWDVQSGRLLTTLYGHLAPVTALQFSPDGTVLITATDDSAIKIWDIVHREK